MTESLTTHKKLQRKYCSRWLSLNFLNSRDLGGLRLLDGGVTDFGRIFRVSSGRDPIPDVVRAISNSFGSVVHYIDLRTKKEINSSKNEFNFVHVPNVVLHSLPLNNSKFSSIPNSEKNLSFFVNIYKEMIFSVGHIVIHIADLVCSGRVPVVVGCQYGKDRTGVVIILLLYLAGVRFSDITKDFSLTARAFRRLPDQVSILAGNEPLSEVLRRCELPSIVAQKVLSDFIQVPGGRTAVAKMLGIDQNSLKKIRSIFSVRGNKTK